MLCHMKERDGGRGGGEKSEQVGLRIEEIGEFVIDQERANVRIVNRDREVVVGGRRVKRVIS